jgi:SAM-dependent methyltransferase
MSKARLLERIIPAPLQRGAQRAFEAFARRSTLAARLDGLESRLGSLEQQLRALEPEVMLPSPACEQAILTMLTEREFAPARRALERQAASGTRLNLAISPNDMMYRNRRHFSTTAHIAHLVYMEYALEIVMVLEAIVLRKFGSWEGAGTVLDFASGYGRMTRFLVHSVAPERLWVSDIKSRAVEFQQEQFGVQGFVSTPEPEDLHVTQRFDCVFVVSLFSHLPQALFARWLQHLCDLLNENGIIIFSVHDATLLEGHHIEPQGEFTYLPTSEETAFRTQDERLDDSRYGSTFVTEAFVRRVIEGLDFPNAHYTRFTHALPGKQDVYVLSREGTDFSNLELTDYASA